MTSLALVRIDLTRRSESQESWKGAHSLAPFERLGQRAAGTLVEAGRGISLPLPCDDRRARDSLKWVGWERR
jgi:hypothetical protein